jgi:dTDP-4-dehydrorhamnose 3,5-epimerase-like enzyme
MSEKLEFLDGGLAVDDRGSLKFINEFSLANYKRFYVVENHRQGFIRAWHGHKHEAKAVVCLQGSALVAGVRIDSWTKPSPDLPVERYVLSAAKPGALLIPAGYANGFMSLTADTILLFFSTSTLAESASDDIRFESRTWDPWHIEER